MTDADVDGAHIRTLLLTFLFRQMPELIERGYVYIAVAAALQASSIGNQEHYFEKEPQLEELLLREQAREDSRSPTATATPSSSPRRAWQRFNARAASEYEGWASALQAPTTATTACGLPERVSSSLDRAPPRSPGRGELIERRGPPRATATTIESLEQTATSSSRSRPSSRRAGLARRTRAAVPTLFALARVPRACVEGPRDAASSRSGSAAVHGDARQQVARRSTRSSELRRAVARPRRRGRDAAAASRASAR